MRASPPAPPPPVPPLVSDNLAEAVWEPEGLGSIDLTGDDDGDAGFSAMAAAPPYPSGDTTHVVPGGSTPKTGGMPRRQDFPDPGPGSDADAAEQRDVEWDSWRGNDLEAVPAAAAGMEDNGFGSAYELPAAPQLLPPRPSAEVSDDLIPGLVGMFADMSEGCGGGSPF